MNPWNTTMKVDINDVFKEKIKSFWKDISSIQRNKRKKYLQDLHIDQDMVLYLKGVYDDGYGLKVLARELDISYTQIRTLFKYFDIPIRKGQSVVTDKVRQFRSDRVKKEKNPWFDWCNNYPKMHKTCSRGIQGYYKKKDGSNVWLRSTWEYIYAKWLDSQDIKWDYEKTSYKLSNGELYRPDFTIYQDIEYIVEIKGYYKDRSYKVDMLRKEHPELNIILISDISQYCDSYKKEKTEWRLIKSLEVK